MITAEDARKMCANSDQKQSLDSIKDIIEDRVRKAIKTGETHCWIDCYIPDVINLWIQCLGYKTERYKGDPKGDFTKIMW